MKRKFQYIVSILLSLYSGTLYSQGNCTVPLPPVLTSVSVQPETSKTEFTWIPSESTDIAAYIIYAFRNGDGQAIDTVWNPAATSDIISNNAPKYTSVSYVVAAHRLSVVPGLPGCTSPLSNVLTTIFCEALIDTCNRKINVSWNSYPSYPKPVTGYEVMLSVNGGAYIQQAVTGPEILTCSLNDFVTDAEYCFYIIANLDGGGTSTSNNSCLSTAMRRPPDWINADNASVNEDNEIVTSFSVDPQSQINDFILERKTGPNGTFHTIAELKSVNDFVEYIDKQADIDSVYYYTLSAINSCNNPITVSNIESNIVLSQQREGNDINLYWNSYRQWLGSISEYRIYVNTGQGFTEKGVVNGSDSTYTLKYSDIMYDVSGKEICIYLTASEASNPHGIEGKSSSSQVCLKPLEIVTVPNIFTPNDDQINDLFKPVLSFTPSSYHLVISDQHGTVLFESRDFNEQWDGKANGKLVPDGVCIWFLKLVTPSGGNMTRTGTITILRDP
jgi:gliding motility-associated-like protein